MLQKSKVTDQTQAGLFRPSDGADLIRLVRSKAFVRLIIPASLTWHGEAISDHGQPF